MCQYLELAVVNIFFYRKKKDCRMKERFYNARTTLIPTGRNTGKLNGSREFKDIKLITRQA